MSREEELKETIRHWREAVAIEEYHRWFYDEYTNPEWKYTRDPIGDARCAQAYRVMSARFPNWRLVLHVAKEIGLPLPDRVNVNRYSRI